MKTNNLNRKYSSDSKLVATIIFIIITLFVGMLFISTTTITVTELLKEKEVTLSTWILTLSLNPISLIFLFLLICTIAITIGTLKAKKEENKLKKIIANSNPYIYYKELPNNYGIGIATLLIDSEIENTKDIIAVILDLCARGYLKLNKNVDNNYQIQVLKYPEENMLLNEKYIMNLIINNNIKDINYQQWLDCCMKDGVNLGLFSKREEKEVNNDSFFFKVINSGWTIRLYFVIIFVVSAILVFCFGYKSVKDLPSGIVFKMINVGFEFIKLVFIPGIPLYLLLIVLNLLNFGNDMKKRAYEQSRIKYIERTELGKQELQKLLSFNAFLNDFGSFAEKNPDEIVLWAYYLSYAHIFGLTDSILKTGYSQLVKNGSFEVDNIDFSLNEINRI